YSKIQDVEILQSHLIAIKEKLLKQGKINYKCIERYKFAYSRVQERFFYNDLIKIGQRLLEQKQNPYFLDIGCCTGTDLRKLLLDGYPKDYLIGIDIEECYIECGYELFKDSPTTCPIQFMVNDLFSLDEKHPLCDSISILHVGSVFHLFSDNQMVHEFLNKITWLLKAGGVLVGGHVCSDQSNEYFSHAKQTYKYYMGIEDFRQLLIKQGFSNIRIETQPRLEDEDDFTAFWISFYAVYSPKG
ncbi:hypothetical protein CU098_013520, partial [Rhizopus stolonifer]